MDQPREEKLERHLNNDLRVSEGLTHWTGRNWLEMPRVRFKRERTQGALTGAVRQQSG